MSNPDHLNNQPLSKREQAILWIVWTTTPVDSDLVGDLTDKLGKVRDEAEGATANAVKANRELQHYYDDEWRYNEVERALRVLGGADQQFLFRIMIGYKWRGSFDDLCDKGVWEAPGNPETISAQSVWMVKVY